VRTTLMEALAFGPGERPSHPAHEYATLARTLALEVLCETLRRPTVALKWLEQESLPLEREARRSLQRAVEAFVEADAQSAAAAASKMAKAQAAAAQAQALAMSQLAAAAAARKQAAAALAPRPEAVEQAAPSAQQPAAKAEEAEKPVVQTLSLYRRARNAAQADPEAAITCALLGGCALYALLSDRRAVGRALASARYIGQMALGGGLLGGLVPAAE